MAPHKNKRLTLKERNAIANATSNDLKNGFEKLGLTITGIIKNSNTAAEASGKITTEVKNLLENRIKLLLLRAGAMNKEGILKQLLELKSEIQ